MHAFGRNVVVDKNDLTALKQLNACKVVFSANNTPQNQAQYKTAGADGCIGKGAISVYHELASIFQEFLEDD